MPSWSRLPILNADLEKPQIEASKLSEFANELNDLEQDVGALKALVKWVRPAPAAVA